MSHVMHYVVNPLYTMISFLLTFILGREKRTNALFRSNTSTIIHEN